jgi:MFS family permease
MTVLAEPGIDVTDDRLAARNALVLAVAQALAGGNATVITATTGIVGSMLAPDPALATLPISTMVLGMWLGTLPVGMLAKAYGRRFALQTGSAFGMLSGLILYAAVLHGSFAVLLIGTFCGGLYAAAHQSYRFAAADTASPKFRPKAVSWVLAGGVFAAIIGSQLVIFTKTQSRLICSPAPFSPNRPAPRWPLVCLSPSRFRARRCHSRLPTVGRCSRSSASRASSLRSPAGWRATP